jgi:hypothetical protein
VVVDARAEEDMFLAELRVTDAIHAILDLQRAYRLLNHK